MSYLIAKMSSWPALVTVPVPKSVEPLKQWYVDKFGDKWLKLLEASIAQAEKEIEEEDRRLLQ